MNEVVYTDEFGAWFEDLARVEKLAVYGVVDKLEALGLSLSYPHSSALNGTALPLRELRPNRGASPLRIVYAYDPRRDVVLIIGGDKSGDATFYGKIIKRAEAIWTAYLAEQQTGKHG
jgi:hypothetical protein